MTNRTVGREKAVTGGSYNSIALCDVNNGTYRFWSAGSDITLHEAVFVPRTPDGKLTRGAFLCFIPLAVYSTLHVLTIDCFPSSRG